MALRCPITSTQPSRPRARARTSFVASVAALMALGPAAEARAASAEADADCDGIIDMSDQCPNQAEVVNDFEDQDGCPDARAAAVKGHLVSGLRFDRIAPFITGPGPTFEFDRLGPLITACVPVSRSASASTMRVADWIQ